MAGRSPGSIRTQFGVDGQPGLTCLRHRDAGKSERHRLACLQHGHVEVAGLHGSTVVLGAPAEPQVGRIRRVPQVGQLDGLFSEGEGERDRLHDRLELVQSRRWYVVAQEHPVHHEVAVVHDLSEVTAVSEERLTVGGLLRQAVIAPLPHESAVQPRDADG